MKNWITVAPGKHQASFGEYYCGPYDPVDGPDLGAKPLAPGVDRPELETPNPERDIV